jgi:hypothetical protein
MDKKADEQFKGRQIFRRAETRKQNVEGTKREAFIFNKAGKG